MIRGSDTLLAVTTGGCRKIRVIHQRWWYLSSPLSGLLYSYLSPYRPHPSLYARRSRGLSNG